MRLFISEECITCLMTFVYQDGTAHHASTFGSRAGALIGHRSSY